MSISRRRFLKNSASIILSASVIGPALARVSFKNNPFSLGVASGAPRPDSVVIWTRLAPDPINGGGLDPQPIEVKWELAKDENFHRIVCSGKSEAAPHYAHSVHVEIKGLEPSQHYWYRFFAGEAVSPVGRTRTAPAPGAITPVSFAFASCQMYEQGYFTAHKYMAQEDLDTVIFLGDYIYEHSWGDNDVRKHEITGDVRTLEQYRNRYALYKTDENLQLCHASFPWIVTWDDHEVSNDYARDRSEDLDKHFSARRAAAYQAYYEHMPLPESCAPHHGGMRLYTAYDYGHARFHILDDRQYRDYQACPKQGRGGSNMVKDCPELLDAERTMLGAEQEKWLKQSLDSSKANWDIIVQQTLMARAKHAGGTVWTDGWDGYPAARRRLLEAATMRGTDRDTIVVGGDIHAWAVCDLKLDYDDPKSKTVATEFCGTSISSQGPSDKEISEFLSLNPHVHFADGKDRGYTTVKLEQNQTLTKLRSIESVKVPNSSMRTIASFVVEKGHPGARKA